MQDHYATLGVQSDVSDDELKRAYRKIAGKNHPDRNPGDAEAIKLFKDAAEAYSAILESRGTENGSISARLKAQIRQVKTEQQKADLYLGSKLAEIIQLFAQLYETTPDSLQSPPQQSSGNTEGVNRLMEFFFDSDNAENYKKMAWREFNDWRELFVSIASDYAEQGQISGFSDRAKPWLDYAAGITAEAPEQQDGMMDVFMKHLAMKIRNANAEITRPKRLA